MIAPMPGAVPLKPGSGTLPMPGVITDVVDLQGKLVLPGLIDSHVHAAAFLHCELEKVV